LSERISPVELRAGYPRERIMMTFHPFRLDTINQCLWRRRDSGDDERIMLPPKAYGVLHYLIEHAGRLVTQEHSGGNPLFRVAALEHLTQRGMISRERSSCQLQLPLEQIVVGVPEGLRQIIELERADDRLGLAGRYSEAIENRMPEAQRAFRRKRDDVSSDRSGRDSGHYAWPSRRSPDLAPRPRDRRSHN
jgi:hypothetical protein